MSVGTPDSGFESLEHRYESLMLSLPYLLLAVPVVACKLSQQPDPGSLAITAGIAAGAAAWFTWMIRLHPAWTQRAWPMRIYLLGLIAFIVALTFRSPWFAFFSWLGFMHAFRFLGGAMRWAACVPVAVAFGAAQSGGFHRATVSSVVTWLMLACVDLILVGYFVSIGEKVGQQNMARKGMIAELAEANQQLEQMIAENNGLQAQLLVQAKEAGVSDERQRMAREIHDTLAQGLTGIITQLGAARQARGHAERERRIGNAEQLARDSLAEARRSVQALRPRALEASRLPEALADEVARWSATSGVAGEIQATGQIRALHPEVEVTLLRVAQEALANVAKHAGASRAAVTLSYMGDVVSLDVRDDGAGFTRPAGGAEGGGFGLIAMRQRVSRLAGQLEIESEPGAGTAVSASLPAIPLEGAR